MEMFKLTLQQMLMMYTLILVGYLLRKKSILPEKSDTAMARMETYIFVPALSLYNMLTRCTVKTFSENYTLILYGLAVMLVAIGISYPLSKLFVKDSRTPENAYRRNIYKYAMTFGNFGFMGNFIILGIWGEEFFFKYSMFTMFVSILCYGWGLYILIPKDKNCGILKNLKRGLLTPPILALFIGIAGGLLNVGNLLPQFFVSALSNASKCQGPVAMVLAGYVIGGYDFKKLILNKKVYFASLLRLIVIPAFLVCGLKLFGAGKEIMTLALIAFATPLGLNTIVYPATYGGETETGASMTMISHTLSVITIPVMYTLLIVMM